jgi:hypothetical protein
MSPDKEVVLDAFQGNVKKANNPLVPPSEPATVPAHGPAMRLVNIYIKAKNVLASAPRTIPYARFNDMSPPAPPTMNKTLTNNPIITPIVMA